MTRSTGFTFGIRALLLSFCLPGASLMCQVNVTTYHNDNSRTGQNTLETTLTPALLNSHAFGKLFSVALDGKVFAQPLLLHNVSIAGGKHNVVYVATEHDSVYAIDANNGFVYWKASFINPPAVTTAASGSSGINCGDITPEYGITSTPVINAGTSTLYAVAKTVEAGSYVHRLHALNVTTGAENPGSPIQIEASLDGNTFDSFSQLNRPALLLKNGHIILAWGSHCDHPLYYGWVMSYNATTLAQEAVYNVNSESDSSGRNAGIWMSGGGVAVDPSGNMYLATGNGDFGSLFPTDFGSSILKLTGPGNGTFSVVDWFTPHNQGSLNDPNDEDLGSGGVLVVPVQAGDTHPHLLVQTGKDGTLHLIDTTHLGHFCSSCTKDTNIVQEIPNATAAVFGSPAYWNEHVYFGSASESKGDHLKAFNFFSTTPQLQFGSQTPEVFLFPTPTPSVSANGSTNGILWLLDEAKYGGKGPAYLHAYDANNLATELYSSSSNTCRDTAAGAIKFGVPTIANGEVFVAGDKQLTVYGQLTSTSLNPASLNFGSHHAADPSQRLVLTLTNTGTHTLFLTIGKLTAPFAVATKTCAANLAPGASCTVTTQFTPSQGTMGTNTQTLVITDSAISGCDKVVLSGSIS